MEQQEPRYEDVRLLLGEGNPLYCTRLHEALIERGMRRTAACSGTESLLGYLGRDFFDLLVYDHELPGGDFFKNVQRIRRRALGKNPFMAVIATVGDSAVETIRKVIDAGVDDVIRKPISIDSLYARMQLLVQKRKPFVVSYGYVGPTRRTTTRPEDANTKVIEIPNTLKGKVLERLKDEDLQLLVDIESDHMDGHKLDAIGQEIDRLANRIGGYYDGGEGSENDKRGDLNRLLVVAGNLQESTAKTGTKGQSIGDLATVLISLTQRVLRAPPNIKVTEVVLLMKLGTAIKRALSVERNSVDLMKEIAGTISSFTRLN